MEAKQHALFHKRLVKSSGVWIAVLLIHFFFWIALNDGRDMPRPHQNESAYLSVALISLSDSAPTPHIFEISPKLKGLPLPKKIQESERPSLQSPPDAFPTKAKVLDYDEMKRAALAATYEPQKRLLPGIEEKISKAEKFAAAIDHAKRGDCRSEYAGIGILAIPLLLRDTLTDKGCKW